MILCNILKGLKNFNVLGADDINIENLSQNSHKIAQNLLFFCINGTKTDGSLYIKDAIKNGAVAVVLESPCNENITQIIVENVRKAMAVMAANFYGNPQNKLKIVGITGTNGKTSCSYIISAILKSLNHRVGVIGTNGVFIGEKKFDSHMTTPDSIELFEIFGKMVKDDIEYCVMEVSAHAIFFDKIYGINFAVKALTNVNFDHLDFFKTKQNYQITKAKFFETGDNFVLNANDKTSQKIIKKSKNNAKKSKKIIIFGKNDANLQYFNTIFKINKTYFDLKYKSKIYHISSRLAGAFNVQNLCLSIGVLLALDFDIAKIVQKISAIKRLPGRFDAVKNSLNTPIIIDYAHTYESLKSFLTVVNRLSKNKNIIVLGAPGERDTTKRMPMGELAGKFCECVILTTDNPASENPKRIAFEISRGVEKTKSTWFFEENRKKAIKKAIFMAIKQKNCNVLIVGKGIETCQIVGDNQKKYSDYDSVFAAIEQTKTIKN